ncbi:uncharacterized protein [Salmo salar]|uniref:Uncharacterized protein n=1 Tax=Salmo salar TaxID=8030 RepID=A0ABM3EEU8_SALSA|nr:uncharacterized protein LOC123739086 [Salmo salar]
MVPHMLEMQPSSMCWDNIDNACENARSREWSDGDGYSRHNMAHWESDPPAGERQYLTQKESEHQWLNREDEAAMRAHYNSQRQNSQMDFRGHRAQETQTPPLYHQEHHRMAQSQNIRDWPNLYGPLRGQAPPNVNLHRSGERTETWAKHEPHFPSNDFLTPLNVERGHEDISHHHNTDQDYMFGWIVNHNNLHYLESKWQMLDPTHSNGHANEPSRGILLNAQGDVLGVVSVEILGVVLVYVLEVVLVDVLGVVLGVGLVDVRGVGLVDVLGPIPAGHPGRSSRLSMSTLLKLRQTVLQTFKTSTSF